MDRPGFEANTDVIVIADLVAERLTWVTRDLYSELVGDRINTAYAGGGQALLKHALRQLGFEAERSICLTPAAVARGFEALGDVVVPVRRPYRFAYPVDRMRSIREPGNRMEIGFEPLAERLSGERLHQWVGARKEIGGPGGDLPRLGRQQVLVAVLLGERRDLSAFIADPAEHRIHGDGVIEDLARIDATWELRRFDRLRPARIDGRLVQVLTD